jgi:membrane dipeptidase
MGHEVIAEMNRVGMVIDMSHSADRSTIEAAEISTRPIAITHANRASWHPARRNKSDEVIHAVSSRGGMLGFSVYPHHLAGKSDCTLDSFCTMIAEAANTFGAEHLGIGTDLCQDQPDSIVEWMRVGRWTKKIDYGEGSASDAGFPPMPSWFTDNRDFDNIRNGLLETTLTSTQVDGIMGDNWYRFYADNFGPA